MEDNKDCCIDVKKIKGYMQNICKRFNDLKKSVEKKAKDCSKSKKIKDYIGAVSSCKIWVCIVVVVLAVIATGVCMTKERQEQMQAQMQKQISESLNTAMENNNICKTLKNYICYDPFCCFLFALALLCVAGGLIVICVLRCTTIRKQALLTYAYDRALDSLEEVKDTDELDGSIEIEERQNNNQSNNQSNNIIKTTETKRKDYKKTIAEIFEAYCQNITAK